MAYSHYVSYTTTGVKSSLNMDPSICPFNASLAVFVGTTATYKIQYSLDPIETADASSRWFDDANLPASTTVSGVTNYMFPVTKVRIDISAVTGTLELKTLQGFMIG